MKQEKLNLFSNQSGYVAIMSAIVISVILISLAFISSFTSYFARFNILDAEYKKKSLGLAEACAEIALLKLAADNLPASEPDINIDGNTCDIVSKDDISVPGQTTIKTQGVYQNSFSNISFTVVNNNFSIISWEEVPNF